MTGPQHPDQRATRRRWRWLVWPVAWSITLVFVAMAAMPLFGMRTMIVLSDSMVPVFRAGDVLLMSSPEPEQVRAGDVIAFHGHHSKHTTTHRVLERREVAGELHFRTQGDANEDPDANLAPAAGVVGTVELVIPRAGRFLILLTGRWGRLAILGPPAILLVIGQARTIISTSRTRRPAFGSALAVSLALVASAAGAATMVKAFASFTATEQAADNTFRTADTFTQTAPTP